jgi:acyl carrier protein
MHERIREVLARTWELPAQDIPPNASPENLKGWDSLRHLELMLELELEFGVRMSAEEVPELVSVDAIEAALLAHGAG